MKNDLWLLWIVAPLPVFLLLMALSRIEQRYLTTQRGRTRDREAMLYTRCTYPVEAHGRRPPRIARTHVRSDDHTTVDVDVTHTRG